MLWLLADDTTDWVALFNAAAQFGKIAGAVLLTFIATKCYDLWRRWKTDRKKDDKDDLELNIQRDEANLNLSIREEEQIEAQLQRVINQQDALITRLQTRRDERVTHLEKRLDALQVELNQCVEKHASQETRADFLQRQLDDANQFSMALKGELDIVKRKYYTLKHGQKPDSDVIPPGTEIAPEK